MIAYVFVYKPTKLMVDSSLRRFEKGIKYDRSQEVIPAGGEATVDLGVYMICSDAADIPPAIQATEGTQTIDYDVSLIDGKDPWPMLLTPDPTQSPDPALCTRVCAAFPDLCDADLQYPMIERKLAAAS
jgi:hypothetical protein